MKSLTAVGGRKVGQWVDGEGGREGGWRGRYGGNGVSVVMVVVEAIEKTGMS